MTLQRLLINVVGIGIAIAVAVPLSRALRRASPLVNRVAAIAAFSVLAIAVYILFLT